MEILRVNIDDVYPVEDEYGNKILSRDYSLKENKRYVEDLAASFGESGEPDEPPVLVRDGGVFRIKAGNTRIKAMELLGTRSFTAVIDDDDTPQSLVEAAIRTDTKKKYEDIERSRFEQQLFLFDDDEYAAKMTGRTVDEVRKVRRTMQAVEDAAEDMTIDRMIALADFEDDEEAYGEIRDAKEGDWQRIAADLKKKREKASREREMREALEAAGVEIVGSVPPNMAHLTSINSASCIPANLPDGCVAEYYEWAGNYSIYQPAKDADPEAEAARAEVDALCAIYKAAREHREAWLAEHIGDDLTALCALKGMADSPYWMGISSFADSMGIELDDMPARAINSYLGNRSNIIPPYAKSLDEIEEEDCKAFVALTDALKASGYEPCGEEQRLYEMAKEAIGGESEEA